MQSHMHSPVTCVERMCHVNNSKPQAHHINEQVLCFAAPRHCVAMPRCSSFALGRAWAACLCLALVGGGGAPREADPSGLDPPPSHTNCWPVAPWGLVGGSGRANWGGGPGGAIQDQLSVLID